jgi:hypothetical protein
MELVIGTKTLQYITNENKYIITSFSRYYDNELLEHIQDIFSIIVPHYKRDIFHSRVCGQNATFICNKLKIDPDTLKPGKIIITDWVKRDSEIRQKIEEVYGLIGSTIDASYHALVYLEINIKNKTYYVAIETTICEPYQLQFYVGNTYDELEKIIKSRYQCNGFNISHDCNKPWPNNSSESNGGKKRKQKSKTKKQKSKRKKTRRRNTR